MSEHGAKRPAARGGRAKVLGAGSLALVLVLAGCAKEPRLPGERIDTRAAAGVTTGGPVASGARAVPIALPPMGTNADWPARAGAPDHAPGHPSLRPEPQLIWSAGIGAASAQRHRLVGDPVVGGGLVFAIDSEAQVTAVTPAGQVAWRSSAKPAGERSTGTGGGLAYAGGKVFVTTSYGELVALDAASGGVVWRQKVDTGIGGAPTVSGGTVFVATRDGTGIAVRAADGRELWTLRGAPARAGVTGVSAPAVSGDTVVFPFTGGLLVAADTNTGARRWVRSLAGKRLGMAYADVSDVAGDPVISGGTVYSGTTAGQLGATALASGQPAWSIAEGASAPVAVAGGSVFSVTDAGRLVRVNAASGEVLWAVDLPYDVHTRRAKNRRDVVENHGPVLAGGRLFVASSDGYLRAFDPASGTMTASVAIPGGASTGIAVAGNTAYVVSKNGQLLAFR
ncbi:PQQ-binding-like beta-propeller repeat protein [Frigidibacter sp. MR17.14]|uniref:outer membrane protein assembly factor BamB family protein n=1 Tax=Frigidibacter sp. MR17.14 TaxID=3126509 RepID=UPI003012AD3E